MKHKIFISFSSSNIHINITDIIDKTIFKQSCKSNKSSVNQSIFYKSLLEKIFTFIKKEKIQTVIIIISGFHVKRFFFLKDFFSLVNKININRIFFISSKPFNGCRKKKRRRLLFLFDSKANV